MLNNQSLKIEKIVVNCGIGKIRGDQKFVEYIMLDLAKITGQKPVFSSARRAIAGFKLRAGEKIGLKVTLRGKKMADFLGRLIKIALPRRRDFRGLDPGGFDGRGNYNIGIREQIIFPEIRYEEADKIFGFQIVIVTNAQNDKDAYQLLKNMGLPLVKSNQFEAKGYPVEPRAPLRGKGKENG